MTNENDICCPKFEIEKWNEKNHVWANKHFIKESIPLFFHIPLPSMIGKKITKMLKMAEESKKTLLKKEDVLILFSDPHPFKSNIYLSVTGSVSGANNVLISGNFVSKVFDGGYNEIPVFIKKMNEFLLMRGQKAKNYFIHYAYCPACAKKYGHNYILLFAEI